jgi:predicted Zn-dependent peptidase
VTQKELEKVRVATRRSSLFPRESVLSIAVSLADGAAVYNDPNRINSEPEKRMAVTAEDIQKAAQKHLRTSNRVVLITQPAAQGAAASNRGGKP